ncbi:SDR family oxidoreductase [Streptomyces griseus]|uniref:SDR family oxidoreductase n=1 Tax=Streptomyces griseus TaxID=1911 RepID=UPI00367753CD
MAYGIDTQVVVVGAGPVGLMLAGELRLGGADVIVLERLTSPTTESRASTLHARTMEIFDCRGLLERIRTPPNERRGHFGGIPLDLTLPGPYPGQWKVPQTRTEEVLQEWALSLGADVRRGHEVRGLSVRPDHVEIEALGPGGPVRLRSLCVVGCDGENSAVRRLAGVDFPGEDAARELIRADVAGIDIPDRRFERLENGLAIAARRSDGVTRVMVHEFGRAPRPRTGAPEFDEIVAAWRRVTREDISGGTPLWVNAFGDAHGQLTSYRHGRVLFAGDAAHRQMPIGGQALNLGIQDAVNLGWKLAVQVSRRGSDSLLDSYHAERHPVGVRVLANIRAQATLLLGGPEAEPMRAVLAEVATTGDGRAHLAGMISGLDVRYAMGDGLDDGGAGHPLLGLRLPPTRLSTDEGETSTAELLRRGRALLLNLSGSGGDASAGGRFDGLRRAAGPWADRVTTLAAKAPDDSPLADVGAVLVRPDGHIAWTGHDTEGLTTALERWLGLVRPRPAPRRTDHRNTTKWRYDMGKLTGKTALVTGSSRGMGRATAIRLAREGALVAVHYTANKEAADEVVATIEKDGGSAFAVCAELGVPGDVHELFLGLERGLKERTGSTELNILVNNAGVMGGVSVEETSPESFDRLFAVNAKAPFFIIQRALKNIPSGGRVINISSGLTRFANPDEIAYAMTKGAVEQLALHFAKLLGPRNITINSVAPGITRNGSPVFDIPEAVEQMAGLSAFNRVGEPEDVADVVAFLAGDEARWITGSFVDATGGTLLG